MHPGAAGRVGVRVGDLLVGRRDEGAMMAALRDVLAGGACGTRGGDGMTMRTLWIITLLLCVSGAAGMWLALTGGATVGFSFLAGSVFGAVLVTVAGDL